MSENESLESKIESLEAEIKKLQEEVDFQAMKHQQWKTQAMMFHDTLWSMIDKYLPRDC